MKLLILGVVLVSAFMCVDAGKEVGPGEEGSAILSRCFHGEIINGEGVENITEEDCDFSQHSCQTKIESKEGFSKVVRQCTQTLACRNNAAVNKPKCYPGENGVRQCFYCCETDLCNSSLEIEYGR